MTALLNSTLLVAIAEIGDKTQFLSLLLAARYGKPIPIILGVLTATFLNHALAAYFGHWVSQLLPAGTLHTLIALLFIGIGLWVLIPDSDQMDIKSRHNAFLTSLVVFFLAEMGDKTQVATMTLGADYPHALGMVVLGTTLGMMIANIPVILLGKQCLQRINVKKIQIAASLCFIGIGLITLAQHLLP
jgi:Ca2+/H+ antiporter, TMEM165/GDT1 family